MSTERILTLRLQRKQYSTEIVERYISYNGSRLDLTEDEYNNLLSRIPEFWNTDKDRLLYFVVFVDKTFLCQRQKDVFNYAIRESEEKLYDFDSVTPEQLNQFIALLSDVYISLKLARTENFYDEIISRVSDVSYMKYQLLELRAKLLKESDYLFISDYPLSDEEKSVWQKYRQDLRDITSQQAFIDSDFMKIKLPISPRPKDQITEIFATVGSTIEAAKDIPEEIIESIKNNLDGLGIEKIIENYTEITIKIELLRSIARFKLPDGITVDEIDTIQSLIPTDDITSIIPPEQLTSLTEATKNNLTNWEDYLQDVDKKIEFINNKLSSYNLDYSLTDILETVAGEMKEKAAKMEQNKLAQELIDDLQMDEYINGEE
jgi:hypothetical protein